MMHIISAIGSEGNSRPTANRFGRLESNVLLDIRLLMQK